MTIMDGREPRRGLVLVTSRRRENRQPEGLRSKNYQNVIWPDDAILYEVGPLSDSRLPPSCGLGP